MGTAKITYWIFEEDETTLVQQLARRNQSPRLWIVTAGAQILPTQADMIAIEQAPLYALCRVIHHEHPELRSTLLDIAPARVYDRDEIEALSDVMLAQPAESEILLRGAQRYVNRVVPTSAKQ